MPLGWMWAWPSFEGAAGLEVQMSPKHPLCTWQSPRTPDTSLPPPQGTLTPSNEAAWHLAFVGHTRLLPTPFWVAWGPSSSSAVSPSPVKPSFGACKPISSAPAHVARNFLHLVGAGVGSWERLHLQGVP